ncbi:hypothetical protein A2311_05430 [candidate division WOR-1 bacterium RIFOXYB2_FULL_48_7]|uniref:Uncharacterized protein n=1 Tax=candidate division WOR-1 bacterium RIFOXYB2_FULL_48_7 TaxID=1802583 RepID=A0A1F4TJR3_UNCSA|nr:MAG: hypothetical protein A2311_05430 [candidate division WOR-1 bacterium RIFOXYB2_FULL_48_7]
MRINARSQGVLAKPQRIKTTERTLFLVAGVRLPYSSIQAGLEHANVEFKDKRGQVKSGFVGSILGGSVKTFGIREHHIDPFALRETLLPLLAELTEGSRVMFTANTSYSKTDSLALTVTSIDYRTRSVALVIEKIGGQVDNGHGKRFPDVGGKIAYSEQDFQHLSLWSERQGVFIYPADEQGGPILPLPPHKPRFEQLVRNGLEHVRPPRHRRAVKHWHDLGMEQLYDRYARRAADGQYILDQAPPARLKTMGRGLGAKLRNLGI